MQYYSSSVVVYWHYSNGYRSPGAHRKVCKDKETARGWIKWMQENKTGFVFDELIG